MHTCPICGYDRLLYPPENYTICPSCYTEFGLNDAVLSHKELRHLWIKNGMPWMGANVVPPPLDWNPIAQLMNIGAIDYEETAEGTLTKVEYVELSGDVSIASRQGVVNLSTRLFRNFGDVMTNTTLARA